MIKSSLMSYFYTPYSGGKPATILVKGHKVIVVSERPDPLKVSLELFGADSIKRLPGGKSKRDHVRFFNELSKSVDGGLVVATDEVSVPEIIKGLEAELPWIH